MPAPLFFLQEQAVNGNGIAIIALAAAAALGAADARAQYPGGGSRGPTNTPIGGHIAPNKADPPRPKDAPVSLTGQVQLVLDKLEDDLRIGAHQQKAWDLYAARVLRYADDLNRARFTARDMQDGGLTVAQQFDRLSELANNRMTAIEEIIDAGRAVYATLGPDQKKLADKGLVLLPLRLASGAVFTTAARPDDGAPASPPPRGK